MFKKLSLIMLLFLTVAIVPPTSTAQVFMLEGSENNRESTGLELRNGDGSWGNLTSTDPYVGLGSGLMVLTLAGTAYACARRKKAKNHSERTGASKLS